MAASRDPFGAAKMKNRAKLISTLSVSGFADGSVRRDSPDRAASPSTLRFYSQGIRAALNRNKYNAIT
jgi:hypothetical protein